MERAWLLEDTRTVEFGSCCNELLASHECRNFLDDLRSSWLASSCDYSWNKPFSFMVRGRSSTKACIHTTPWLHGWWIAPSVLNATTPCWISTTFDFKNPTTNIINPPPSQLRNLIKQGNRIKPRSNRNASKCRTQNHNLANRVQKQHISFPDIVLLHYS